MAKRILIAEDEQATARALELKLTHEGFEVVVVSDGEEVLDELKKGVKRKFKKVLPARKDRETSQW